MDEISFVIKTFLTTCFFVFCLQMEVKGAKVEHHLTSYLGDSVTAHWLRDMGSGAIRVTASTYDKTMGKVLDKDNNIALQNLQELKRQANNRNRQMEKIDAYPENSDVSMQKADEILKDSN